MDLKLFLIDSDNLRRNLFEKVFSENIYTLDSFEDAFFRIPEFSPDLVLVAADLAKSLGEEESQRFLDTEIPCALLGKEEEVESLRKKGWPRQFLKLPIEFSKMDELVQQLFQSLKDF